MPETTTMMRAWRTDSGEEPATAKAAGPASRTGTPCEGQPADRPGPPSSRAGSIGLGRLGAAVVRAGLRAWASCFGRREGRFEEVLHDYAAELGISRDPGAIEAALVRMARRIAPSGRIELMRATGELAPCEGAHGDRGRAGEAGRQGHGGMRPAAPVEEFPVRCGVTHHGVLRLHTPASRDRRARRETRRRLATACTLAACALENARWQAEWTREGEDEHDDERIANLAADSDAGARRPGKHPDVVRDATFLNAVLPFALGQSRRHGEPVSLLCVQLDRLGAIRDLLGTSLADRLVQELGETVTSLVRASDIVARLDDDRIVALLVRARGDGAMKVARTIGRVVAESGLGSPRLPGVSAAIGVAEFPATASDAASLLEAADEAMAMARAGGSRSPVLAGPRSRLSVVRSPLSVVC
jgi:diguanylate cyclase (GGDEF)-like protein